MLYVVIWINFGGQWGIGGVTDSLDRAEEIGEHWQLEPGIVFVRIEHCLSNKINK